MNLSIEITDETTVLELRWLVRNLETLIDVRENHSPDQWDDDTMERAAKMLRPSPVVEVAQFVQTSLGITRAEAIKRVTELRGNVDGNTIEFKKEEEAQ